MNHHEVAIWHVLSGSRNTGRSKPLDLLGDESGSRWNHFFLELNCIVQLIGIFFSFTGDESNQIVILKYDLNIKAIWVSRLSNKLRFVYFVLVFYHNSYVTTPKKHNTRLEVPSQPFPPIWQMLSSASSASLDIAIFFLKKMYSFCAHTNNKTIFKLFKKNRKKTTPNKLKMQIKKEKRRRKYIFYTDLLSGASNQTHS